jgi:hypothetical protein
VDGADFSWIQEDARNFNPDVIFDIHTNAFNRQAQGTVIFVNSEGYEFGVIAYENIAPLSPGNDRGIHTTNEFAILRILRKNGSIIPAMLAELLFHDNYAEFAYYVKNYDKFATEIERSICQYFNIEFKEDNAMKLVVTPYDVPDKNSAMTLAEGFHLPFVAACDIKEDESYIQVGGSTPVNPDRTCARIISGSDRYETSDLIAACIRSGKLL